MKAILICATAVGIVVHAHADVFTNITEVVRAGNAATATLLQGTSYGIYKVTGAFDGDTTNGTGRALFINYPTAESPVIIGYSIAADFLPDSRFVVTAFRFYRTLYNDELQRSITRIRLEVSENGVDGWVALGGNEDSPVPHDAINLGVRYYTVTIPANARRDGRHYRFVITDNAGGDVNYHTAELATAELELLGEITTSETLTWNGGENGTWNASTANWLSTNGESVAWGWRRKAVIGSAAVALDGEVEVSELAFTGAVSHSISGGTLAMRSPGRIVCKDGDTITSAIAGGKSGMDTASACVDGTCVHSGFLPHLDGDERYGKPVVVWQNRKVSEITGIGESQYAQTFVNNLYRGYPMFFTNTNYGVCFQMHSHGSTTGGSETLLLGEAVDLYQQGDDVVACAKWSRYVWNKTEPLDLTWHTSSSYVGYLIDTNNSGQTYRYGFKGLLASSEVSSAITVDCGGDHFVLDPGTYLPPSDTDNKTGKAVTFIDGAGLVHLGNFVDAVLTYDSAKRTYVGQAQPCHIVRTADAVTVQFQAVYHNGSDPILCVKVEFVPNEDDVNARVVYAKYAYGQPLGIDFDSVPNSQKVAVNEYGLRNIRVRSGATLHLDGAVDSSRSFAVENGILDLGAPSLSLAQPFAGSGTLAFSPASGAQTVAFNGVCRCGGGMVLSGATTVTVGSSAAFATNTPVALNGGATLALADGTTNAVGRLSFVGANTIRFGAGASLSAESLTLADGATVDVVLNREEDATNCLRIGTSRILSRDALRCFRVNGPTGVRQLNDGWLDFNIRGLILRIN